MSPTPESVQVFARVMTAACEHFGASVKDTVGRTRSVQASLARHATIAVMSALGYTSAHIAGLMDRTSGGISASLRKSRDLLETEKGFVELVDQLVAAELQRNKEQK